MKTMVLTFDDSSYFWDKSLNYMSKFIEHLICYLRDKMRHKGYLYLNEICETFGIAWNSNDENVCYKMEDGLIDIVYTEESNAYKIYIAQ